MQTGKRRMRGLALTKGTSLETLPNKRLEVGDIINEVFAYSRYKIRQMMRSV
jgi:hypothetical protein